MVLILVLRKFILFKSLFVQIILFNNKLFLIGKIVLCILDIEKLSFCLLCFQYLFGYSILF